MGRPRGGKAKKSMEAAKEDAGSGAEDVMPAYKRRGRPKLLKDDIDDEEEDMAKVEDDGVDAKKVATSKDSMGAAESGGKKRRRQSKRGPESATEKNIGEPARPLNGFRQNGSRRKSTPRRAAEAGVQSK